MANQGHVEILKQKVEVWNRWRKENRDIRPNLSVADFSGAHLGWADLHGADLSRAVFSQADLSGAAFREANLSEADLSGANLVEAYLFQANLSGADLRRANLYGVDLPEGDLRGANLCGADLSATDLHEANLRYANLRGADLSDAIAWGTGFGNLGLSVVKGLETIQHEGSSTIGIDTICRSRGKIPEDFLQWAGAPDIIVASLIAAVIEYYSCLISYSTKNEAFAQRLHADLQDNGMRCRFAPKDVKIGDKVQPRIQELIKGHDKLLLVLSEHSINSSWVKTEVEIALEEESKSNRTVLFPLRLDATVMETNQAWAANIRRPWDIGDFSRWKDHDSYQQAFARLLRDLKATHP